MKINNSSFPFIRHSIKDHFNENNNFLISKHKALSPLDEELNEVEIIEEFIRRNFYPKFSSNLKVISSRCVDNSNISLSQNN